MSDTETTTTASAKAPSHYVYHVRESKGQKGFWTKIGAAWAHGDGKGFNIQVECVPLDGRLAVRVASEAKD